MMDLKSKSDHVEASKNTLASAASREVSQGVIGRGAIWIKKHKTWTSRCCPISNNWSIKNIDYMNVVSRVRSQTPIVTRLRRSRWNWIAAGTCCVNAGHCAERASTLTKHR